MFIFARKSVGRATTSTGNGSVSTLGNSGRLESLDQICKFMLQHELEVNLGNLTLAHQVVLAKNVRLNRQLNAGLCADVPVTEARLVRLTSERTQNSDSGAEAEKRDRSGLNNSLQVVCADANMKQLSVLDREIAFGAMLQHEYRAAHDARQPFCVALCDIDQFELINDTHGEDAGDRVTQAVARALQRIHSRDCQIARNAGVEFALLLRGVTPNQVREGLDYVRKIFARRKLIDRKTHVAIGRVTLSGGVADVQAYKNPEAALKAAQEALRTAKEQGGNRIGVAL